MQHGQITLGPDISIYIRRYLSFYLCCVSETLFQTFFPGRGRVVGYDLWIYLYKLCETSILFGNDSLSFIPQTSTEV